MGPAEGIRVLSLAINLPGPVAVDRLYRLGAAVVKIEPPAGDPLARALPRWYELLHRGQTVLRLDLKTDDGRRQFDQWLGQSDLLVTSTRPAALGRLGLDWASLHARYPRLCQVAIIGYPPPDEEVPGHDLTYQARAGLVEPPRLPRTCLADLAGAQEVVGAALALLLARERGQGGQYARVSLAEAAVDFAAPWRHGLTTPDGFLGGGWPGYDLYRAREGWVAVAALEPHFWEGLTRELGLTAPDREQMQQVFLTKTAAEWEAWAAARGKSEIEHLLTRGSLAVTVAPERSRWPCRGRCTLPEGRTGHPSLPTRRASSPSTRRRWRPAGARGRWPRPRG
jgi:crotonobetainyl-CoA:carnitine CoA-transferase CaiB-like acyl-CoA transferase